MRAGCRVVLVLTVVFASLLSVSYGCDSDSTRIDMDLRIVSGFEAEPCKYGFIASLRKVEDTSHHCAGVLIDKDWVVTSASCLVPLLRQKFRVYVGGHKRDEPKEDHAAVDWAIPTGWRGDTRSGFDIALVKISSSSRETPAKLPDLFSNPVSGASVFALGWGRLSQSSGFADALNIAKGLTVKSPVECFRSHGGRVLGLLCAGGQGSGTCAGDEGGPLVTENNVLIGIAVFIGDASSAECGTIGKPSLFTDVGRHVPWIKRVLGHK